MPETTEIHITRVFDAPRELVFRAFTDPEQLAQWFGPVGYSSPVEEIVIEPHSGGRERIVMVRDDDPSERHESESLYTEVVVNELLVGKGEPLAEDLGPGWFRFEFHDEPDAKTRLELRVWPVTEKVAEEVTEGWMSSFTKLDAYAIRQAQIV